MKGELKMDVNEYLPLRDVVFNTLRQFLQERWNRARDLWKSSLPISLE